MKVKTQLNLLGMLYPINLVVFFYLHCTLLHCTRRITQRSVCSALWSIWRY